MSDESKPLTYDEIVDKRVAASLKRLNDFAGRLHAPAAVVAMETALLVERLALKYGAVIYSALGTRAIQHANSAMGFCPFCEGTPNRVDPTLGMCTACFQDAERVDDAIDSVVSPDAKE